MCAGVVDRSCANDAGRSTWCPVCERARFLYVTARFAELVDQMPDVVDENDWSVPR